MDRSGCPAKGSSSAPPKTMVGNVAFGHRLGGSKAGYCLVTPGGGGVKLGLSQGSATHPPIPSNPTPPLGGGGSVPSTHSHIQAEQN